MPPKNTAEIKFSKGTNGSNVLKNNDIIFTYAKNITIHRNSKLRGTLIIDLRSNKNKIADNRHPFVALKHKKK